MNNADEILKRVLLNMRYDSRKTLNENKETILNEDGNPNKKDTKEFWDELFKKGKIDKKTYDYQIERIDGLELSNSFNGAVKKLNTPYSDETSTNAYDDATYVTYKTVVPGKNISFPITSKGLQPLKWHDKNLPYNDYKAKYLFGNSCLRLSGKDPNYKVGYDHMKDYYIDDNGNQCKPTSNSQVFFNKTYDKKYDYKREMDWTSEDFDYKHYYTPKGTEDWKLASGEMLKFILKNVPFINDPKTEYYYKSGCKPLPYDICLKWSWKSLMEFGGVDKGLERFSYQKSKESPLVYYSACMRKNNFPWLSEYAGFYDESKMTKGSYNELVKQETGGSCDQDSITDLPSIPSIKYGRNNESSSDINQMKKIANTYSNQQEKYYNLVNSGSELAEPDKQKITQINSVVLGGLRIKGR